VHFNLVDVRMMMATCTHCGTLEGWEVELHGKNCGTLYTIADNVYNFKMEDHYPVCPYPSGYGAKIPTRYMVKYNSGKRYEANHWRRVYMMQYGNAGSAYIMIRKKVVFLDSSTESKLEGLFR
jgi:hypothetical protein